jgi:sugar phosphate isomerase/epimerase
MAQIKRSVSLYSYAQSFYDGKLDLEGCIREVSKAGATGIKLLPEQMMWDYPEVTDEFLENWFHWMNKYGVEPSGMDCFLENHIYDNRPCTLREQIDLMTRDMQIANMLGYKVMRVPVSMPMDLVLGCLDPAVKYDIKLALEVHSPFSLNSGWSEGYLEMIQRTGTRNFGFMPDWGIFCRGIPTELTEQAKRKGATADGIKIVQDAYAERIAQGFVQIKYDLDLGKANMEYRKANGMFEMIEKIEKHGNQADKDYAFASFTYTWNDPQDVVDNAKYIYYTHSKFYAMDSDYKETVIPIPEVIATYKKAGYEGYVSSEYEGWQLRNDALAVEDIEQVRRHQEALRRAIEE